MGRYSALQSFTSLQKFTDFGVMLKILTASTTVVFGKEHGIDMSITESAPLTSDGNPERIRQRIQWVNVPAAENKNVNPLIIRGDKAAITIDLIELHCERHTYQP